MASCTSNGTNKKRSKNAVATKDVEEVDWPDDWPIQGHDPSSSFATATATDTAGGVVIDCAVGPNSDNFSSSPLFVRPGNVLRACSGSDVHWARSATNSNKKKKQRLSVSSSGVVSCGNSNKYLVLMPGQLSLKQPPQQPPQQPPTSANNNNNNSDSNNEKQVDEEVEATTISDTTIRGPTLLSQQASTATTDETHPQEEQDKEEEEEERGSNHQYDLNQDATTQVVVQPQQGPSPPTLLGRLERLPQNPSSTAAVGDNKDNTKNNNRTTTRTTATTRLTLQGGLQLEGRTVPTSSRFLWLTLHPRQKRVVCKHVFDNVLVLGNATSTCTSSTPPPSNTLTESNTTHPSRSNTIHPSSATPSTMDGVGTEAPSDTLATSTTATGRIFPTSSRLQQAGKITASRSSSTQDSSQPVLVSSATSKATTGSFDASRLHRHGSMGSSDDDDEDGGVDDDIHAGAAVTATSNEERNRRSSRTSSQKPIRYNDTLSSNSSSSSEFDNDVVDGDNNNKKAKRGKDTKAKNNKDIDSDSSDSSEEVAVTKASAAKPTGTSSKRSNTPKPSKGGATKQARRKKVSSPVVLEIEDSDDDKDDGSASLSSNHRTGNNNKSQPTTRTTMPRTDTKVTSRTTQERKQNNKSDSSDSDNGVDESGSKDQVEVSTTNRRNRSTTGQRRDNEEDSSQSSSSSDSEDLARKSFGSNQRRRTMSRAKSKTATATTTKANKDDETSDTSVMLLEEAPLKGPVKMTRDTTTTNKRGRSKQSTIRKNALKEPPVPANDQLAPTREVESPSSGDSDDDGDDESTSNQMTKPTRSKSFGRNGTRRNAVAEAFELTIGSENTSNNERMGDKNLERPSKRVKSSADRPRTHGPPVLEALDQPRSTIAAMPSTPSSSSFTGRTPSAATSSSTKSSMPPFQFRRSPPQPKKRLSLEDYAKDEGFL